MQKNVAGQKWIVFAFDKTNNTAKTGDAANITANLRIDGGAANAVDDVNPTELEDGYYIFDITQAETNGEYILICPQSSTANIQVIGVPGAVFTTPPNFPDLGIETDGNITKVNTLDGHTAQTGDTYALANGASGFVAIDTVVDSILVDTGTTLDNHLTDIKGTGFVKDTNSLVDLPLASNYTAARAGYLDNINGHTAQTGDSFARIGTTGSGLTSLAQASVCTETRLAELAAANLPADIDAILVDTGTTLDGKLNTIDTNVDAILVDTGTTLPGTLTTIEGKIDTVDGIADDILVDTGTTIPGTITTMQGNVTDILADTNELQADWANGGRLDLLLDAIPTSNESGFEKNVAVTAFSWAMVDETDHITLETGLQAALRSAGGAQISKDGGAFADLTNIGLVNHVGSGVYEVDITQAEMNADSVVLKFAASGADTRIIYIKTSS